MKIIWNKVTKFSQIIAIILFVFVFCLGVFIGKKIGIKSVLGNEIANVNFKCENNRSIHAVFYKDVVHIALSAGPDVFLAHAISASGARYANADESLVFWNKGNTAFVTEGNPNVQTYKDCVIK